MSDDKRMRSPKARKRRRKRAGIMKAVGELTAVECFKCKTELMVEAPKPGASVLVECGKCKAKLRVFIDRGAKRKNEGKAA